MTACYATERRSAIHRLGDHYDCCCHPEIMNAFIYALNDSDERVRRKAADEIGDQTRRNRCCCGAPVIRALQCALGDCDRGVRRQAEEALHFCGYRVVDGCCSGGCADFVEGCGSRFRAFLNPKASAAQSSTNVPMTHTGLDAPSAVTETPATIETALSPSAQGELSVPPPAPAAEPQAYFPPRFHDSSRSFGETGLSQLFGMAN